MCRLYVKPLILLLFCISFSARSQVNDSLFLMNGKIVLAPIIDTSLGTVTILDTKDTSKRIGIDYEDLYGIRSGKSGKMYYFYTQDSVNGNFFSRDEMQFFMRGERDAKAGFKAKGSFWTSIAVGFGGGLMGSYLSPIPAFACLGFVGLPKVRIKHETVSNPYYLDSDPYILGYERQARSKRRIESLKGGLSGLVIGLLTNFALGKAGYHVKF